MWSIRALSPSRTLDAALSDSMQFGCHSQICQRGMQVVVPGHLEMILLHGGGVPFLFVP